MIIYNMLNVLYLNVMAAFENLTPMNWSTIKTALDTTWKGLLAIFAVIFIIIVIVKLIQWIIIKITTPPKDE